MGGVKVKSSEFIFLPDLLSEALKLKKSFKVINI